MCLAVAATALALAHCTSARPGAPSDHAIALDRRFAPGSRILWVGAHPDDEIVAAPLLGELCASGKNVCRFLLLTRGEAGTCRLADECRNLAALRASEGSNSAAILDAAVTQWQLPDGMSHRADLVLGAWSRNAGGCKVLLGRMQAALAGADIVLSFEPDPGTSHDTDHFATAILVESTLASMKRPPALFTIRNPVHIARGGAEMFLSPAAGHRQGELRSTPGDWAWTLAAARVYRSQFDRAAIEHLEATPKPARIIVAAPRVRSEWRPALCNDQ